MANIKRLVVTLSMLFIACMLSGCIFMLPDLGERVDGILNISTLAEGEIEEAVQEGETLLEEEELDETWYEGDEATVQFDYEVLPYFSDEELCYSGEVYNQQDNICTLPVTCVTNDACTDWGNRVVFELETKYESFKNFYGFLDESDSYIDVEEQLNNHNNNQDSWFSNWLENYHTPESTFDEEIVAYYLLNDLELVVNPGAIDGYNGAWYFDEFKWIIPSEQLWMLDSFSLFKDDYLLSYVVQEEDDLSSWNLAMNINSNITYQDSISTHVHEFAHLLFLNSEQVKGTSNIFSCNDQIYVEEKGCLYEESYTQAFINQFGNDYNQVFDDELYVSEYAATNPLEDMAESFYMFVLTPTPQGETIANQKVLFFYNYDELVLLRAEILSRVATYMYRSIYL